jgi:hypothetical protein
MDKQQIREALIDWWIPDSVIDAFLTALMDVRDVVEYKARNDVLLVRSKHDWFKAMVAHDGPWADLIDEAYQDVDYLDINCVIHDAYVLWFMEQYDILTKDWLQIPPNSDTLVG